MYRLCWSRIWDWYRITEHSWSYKRGKLPVSWEPQRSLYPLATEKSYAEPGVSHAMRAFLVLWGFFSGYSGSLENQQTWRGGEGQIYQYYLLSGINPIIKWVKENNSDPTFSNLAWIRLALSINLCFKSCRHSSFSLYASALLRWLGSPICARNGAR